MRLSLICAAGLAASAFAASTPAKADPYHVVRYSDTGYCLIWDDGLPTAPWPNNYIRVGVTVPNLVQALALKDSMVRAGTCAF
jgi:hypothetical protein